MLIKLAQVNCPGIDIVVVDGFILKHAFFLVILCCLANIQDRLSCKTTRIVLIKISNIRHIVMSVIPNKKTGFAYVSQTEINRSINYTTLKNARETYYIYRKFNYFTHSGVNFLTTAIGVTQRKKDLTWKTNTLSSYQIL